MKKRQPNRSGFPEALASIAVATGILFVLDSWVGWQFGEPSMGSVILHPIIGGGLILVGAMGLVRLAFQPAGTEMAAMAGHVAVVLTGSLFLTWGWAAMLGLALLASTALVVQGRGRESHSPPPVSDK